MRYGHLETAIGADGHSVELGAGSTAVPYRARDIDGSAGEPGGAARVVLRLRLKPAALPELAGILPEAPAADADRLGKNDFIFPPEGADRYKRDLKNVEFHLLDTGHFALEEEGPTIAALMRSFLAKQKL